jgi:hypothetical protein
MQLSGTNSYGWARLADRSLSAGARRALTAYIGKPSPHWRNEGDAR